MRRDVALRESGRRHASRDQTVDREARVHGGEIPQTANQQNRRYRENDRE
jgi:hypothetical protein